MRHSGGNPVPHQQNYLPSAVQIARIAAKQFSVISLAQLYDLGFTYAQVRGLVDRGFLHRLFEGVYAVGHPKIGPWGWLTAAYLAAGPKGFVSRYSSAAARDLRQVYSKGLEITVVGGTRRKSGLIVHRMSNEPHPDDLTTKNGIVISSLPQMLIELSPAATPAELDRLITNAARRGLLDLAAIEAALERHARRPGIRKLRKALAGYIPEPDYKSKLERIWADALNKNPGIPKPIRNYILDGRWELDSYWPVYGVVVEIDGRPYHIAVRDMEKDKFKDGKLLADYNLETLRFTGFRLETDIAGALNDLRKVLSRRRPRAGS